ncbi:DNA polymerase delta subunit 2 [Frankliniella fusca]|uniref:DNA polymerase delta subunit 2 n=1 Tax=Frankliniella fusca TaxID=407009 RepID=A0AAE1LCH0_9NEOP|nr:DNA polymerase delta subunit 2 [Frankliniella fusca]
MKLNVTDCAGRLMANPSEESVDVVIDRVDSKFQDHSDRFRIVNKDFSRQYFHFYAERLSSMKELLLPRINQKWGNDIPVKTLADLKEDSTDRCIIVGTLFKHQELKPSILKEISEENQLVPLPPRSEFTHDEDQLILEDELQRIKLLGDLSPHSVITGVVCAVLGAEHEGGKFRVEEYCFPTPCGPSRPLTPPAEDRYIVLVSGLDLAGSADVLFPFELLVDWVSGWLGDVGEQKNQALVSRILFAGNSIRCKSANRGAALQHVSEGLDQSNTLDAVKTLDDFLEQLSSNIPVDIMPGEFDPSNCTLPQQPLHCCMFPKAAAFKSLHSSPNPYDFEVDGRRIIGTAGQPVDDIAAFTRISDRLEILQRTLEWGHLAPSSPDTLRCYPFSDTDPFIIKELPDVYFVGNQPSYQSKIFRGDDGKEVRLICIPKFYLTKTCVVLNLRNLECHTMTFGEPTSEDMEVEK